MPIDADLEIFRSEVRACLEASHRLLLTTLSRNGSRVGWRQFLRSSSRIGTFGTACGLIAYHAVAPTDTETLESVAACLANIQRPDGSWESPTIAEGVGLTTATCYAVLALYRTSSNRHSSQIQKGEDWIAAQIQENGAIGHTVIDRTPFTICVCLAVRALNQNAKERHATSIDRALQYLLQIQNADGGFGTAKNSPSTLHHTSEAIIALSNAVSDVTAVSEAVEKAARFLMSNHRLGDNRHKDTDYVTSADREAMLPHTYQTDGLLLQAHIILDSLNLPARSLEIAEWLIQYQKEGYWEHDLEMTKAPSWSVMECAIPLANLLNKTAGDRASSNQSVAASSRAIVQQIILVIATEWSSRHGGLSTFNRELCRSLARAGQSVTCFVPSATTEERNEAISQGVTLCTPRSGAGSSMDSLFRPPTLPKGFEPTLVVGHGRITGKYAEAQVADNFTDALRLHFLHMDPFSIEWYKQSENPSQAAENRLREEKALCQGKVMAVAVGPRLTREFATHLHGRNISVHRFDPGMGIIRGNDEVPGGIRCLVLGRAEDILVKGLDIAARAMSLLPHPTPRPFSSQPILHIRGAPYQQGGKTRELLTEYQTKPIDIRVSEYTFDADDIAADIQSASVVLMPSRSEGYGLVASEALAAGRPVLVSNCSGFAELLQEHFPTEESNFVVSTTGDLVVDSTEWSRSLEFILRDRTAAFARARDLRDKLNERVSWDSSVDSLLAKCRIAREHSS